MYVKQCDLLKQWILEGVSDKMLWSYFNIWQKASMPAIFLPDVYRNLSLSQIDYVENMSKINLQVSLELLEKI